MQLQLWGETRRGRFCFDVGDTCGVALVLRRPLLLAHAHPQVGAFGEVKIHVEGIGSPGVVVSEEVIHDGGALSL